MPERKVYRFKIDPTAKQEAALSRYAGARKFVFNWALQRRKETYEQTGKSISWSGLSAELTGLKSKPGFECRLQTPRIVRHSGRSNTKPDGATETLSILVGGFHHRNCVRSVDIGMKSYRSLTVSGNARLVGPAMIEIIMRLKTSETKGLEYSSR